jgi:hydroxymethylglutaryl-CoA lyase
MSGKRYTSTMTSAVTVVEVGPRDGLQNERVVVPTTAKVEYVEALVAAGVRRVEAASFVNPQRVPQMADAEAVLARVPRTPGVSYIGLVLNDRGAERAIAAGVDEANIVLVTTDTFSQRNQGATVEQAVASFERTAARSLEAGLQVTATVGASFGCPFEGEVSTEQVLRIVRRAVAAGVHEIALADTIGVGVPADVRRLVDAVRAVTAVPLRFHFHNTRNTGYANALAAVEAGVDVLDASAGGIGGCPFAPSATGNIATEDLAYALRRSGVATGLDLPGLVDAAAAIGRHLGVQVPSLLGRAGDFPQTQEQT